MKRSRVQLLERIWLAGQRRLNFTGRHDFHDRSKGATNLVLVLAGHKPHLWEFVLPRLERFLPPDADVCFVCPGKTSPEIAQRAEQNGWSYLSSRGNHPSLAMNLAIEHHPAAQMILKVDEDVLISEGTFERLSATYRRVEEEGQWWPGFVAPLLNVNGYSYVPFLEELGLTDAYRERFGPLIHAGGPLPITEDGEAAQFVWDHTLPFDEVAARFSARPPHYSTVPHKFSIGAILFSREFWDRFGGFKVRPFVGGVGVDEAHICGACTTFSRVMVVSHDVLAGHFSYGPQDPHMRGAIPELREGMTLAPELARD